MSKVQTNVDVRLAIPIMEPHPPNTSLPSSWPHGFKEAFTISNDQQLFDETVTVVTSTNWSKYQSRSARSLAMIEVTKGIYPPWMPD